LDTTQYFTYSYVNFVMKPLLGGKYVGESVNKDNLNLNLNTIWPLFK
jgi:hypothetical protein